MSEAHGPILSETVAAHRLVGYSGADIWLASTDGHSWFVRKVAGKVAGNERLKAQIAKQEAFRHAVGTLVRTPRVLEEGEIEGRYFADMEYVRGTDAATYLRRAGYSTVVQFADQWCEYLRVAASVGPIAGSSSASLFEALYARVSAAERKGPGVGDAALRAVFLGLEQVRILGHVPTTFCHGDLTLENILIDPQGRLWVVDLLNSPYETWWQDVAKLHQDLTAGWYQRRQPPIARGVVDYLSRRLRARACEITPEYAMLHDVLLVVTLLRILPYVASDSDVAFLRQRVERLARRIPSQEF